MSQRFFSKDTITGDRGALAGPEVHHLLHVMRAAAGHRIDVFDGSGAEFHAEITTTHRNCVEFNVLERRDIDRELPFRLTLAVALPKGDRQKWLVEKLTELGVTRLVPLITERGVARPTDSTLGRLSRCVIEACKQCGRNRLMQIDAAITWTEFIGGVTSLTQVSGLESPCPAAAAVLLAHSGGSSVEDVLSHNPIDRVIIVGPEGGFTADEFASALVAGAQPLSLGPRTLRVETAAVAVASIFALSI